MDACIACGSKLVDGITKCPDCGATLVRRGTGLMAFGWVMVLISLIPLSVGIVVVRQRSFIPIILGGAIALAGFALITFGSMKLSTSLPTTKKVEAESQPAPAPQPTPKR